MFSARVQKIEFALSMNHNADRMKRNWRQENWDVYVAFSDFP